MNLDKTYPNETAEYRASRDALLQAEIALRAHIRQVAQLRSKLPIGGLVKEDYVFDEMRDGVVKQVRLSELFAPGKPSLIIYSMMFGPNQPNPCPSCTSLVDGFNAASPHVNDRTNMVIIAKSPIERVRKFADDRGWKQIRILSSANNTYNADYWAERTPDPNAEPGYGDEDLRYAARSGQMPMMNVFVKRDDGVHHFWGSEMAWARLDGEPRHVDLMWPMWNLFDLTPEGRGTDWAARLSYATAGSGTK